jgi:hypothetical protein
LYEFDSVIGVNKDDDAGTMDTSESFNVSISGRSIVIDRVSESVQRCSM